jgi:hypothetical protein
MRKEDWKTKKKKKKQVVCPTEQNFFVLSIYLVEHNFKLSINLSKS